MKISTLFLVIISIIGSSLKVGPQEYIYWENMNNDAQEDYIAKHNVNSNALNYYKNKFQINDDEKTIKLLETLVSSKKELLPLYFYLFNKICSESDGATSEILGKYCMKMIINNPNYVIHYFTLDRLKHKKEKYYYQIYADMLGYEMYFKEEGTSDIKYNYKDFKNYLNKHLRKTSQRDKKTLGLLYANIQTAIRNMSN